MLQASKGILTSFVINKVIIAICLEFIILVKILHCLAKSKVLCPHCCERHQTKSSGCFDLPSNLSLGLGTNFGLHNKKKSDEKQFQSFIIGFVSVNLTQLSRYLAPLDDNSSICYKVGKESHILFIQYLQKLVQVSDNQREILRTKKQYL